MRKLNVFNFLTLNGFFEGSQKGDISWHKHDTDENEFAEKNVQSGGALIFGRMTYQMMASYWPTAQAKKDAPVIADGMNKAEKIVFSTTLKKAEWNNTRLITGNLVEEVKKLKQLPGGDMTILGSGSIVTQLTDVGLIDEYQFMIDPVALGVGTPVFNGIKNPLKLKLVDTKTLKSGVVVLSYLAV
jgi:dihydrofolate reductase